MAEAIPPPPAPLWVRLASLVIRRLPAGRYRAISIVSRFVRDPFIMRLPDELGGYRFKCDLRDSIAREVCFTGRYEPQETALVRSILTPSMVFADVGANWGYFTLLAAHLVGPYGRVVSLEPDPRLFRLLRENAARNRLQHVTVLALAAAARRCVAALAGYNESSGNFGLSRLASSAMTGVPVFSVATEALDQVLDDHGVDSVDLMKMDIEGSEAHGIAGLSRSLVTKRIKRLLLELHPAQLVAYGSSAASVIQTLRGYGYTGLTIDHSPTATRRAAYAPLEGTDALLRPIGGGDSFNPWPHQLWFAPGVQVP